MGRTKGLIVLADPVRNELLIYEKEPPKIYVFKCEKCGKEEERICADPDEALASYIACKKCAACAAIVG